MWTLMSYLWYNRSKNQQNCISVKVSDIVICNKENCTWEALLINQGSILIFSNFYEN